MPSGDASKQVDAYIDKSPEFARPILKKIRKLFHKAFPQIEEAMKWSTPAFLHKGIVAVVAAFKQHVRLAFWKGKLMSDPEGLFAEMGDSDMGALKLTDVSELPPDKVLLACISEAVDLNEREVKPATTRKTSRPKTVDVPDDLMAKLKLKKNKKAREVFEAFSPSHKREYVEWIVEAKRDETRKRRVEQAVALMLEGKSRNWKYQKKT